MLLTYIQWADKNRLNKRKFFSSLNDQRQPTKDFIDLLVDVMMIFYIHRQ